MEVQALDNTEYTAKDIQVLTGLQAIRRRPGMYIGSTDQRGLHHLVYEILDNAVDEAMAGYCSGAEVTIQEDGSVTVRDDGRGIPTDVHPTTGKSALETVLTTLHAGAKFDSGAYKVSGGLHGVGASVVNALSSRMQVEVCRDGQVFSQEYRRGAPITEVQVTGNGHRQGTSITFLPDKEIFDTTEYDFETLRQHFMQVSFLNKGMEIHFTSHKHRDEHGRYKEISYYFEGGLSTFLRHVNRKRNPLQPAPFYMLRNVNSSIVECAIQYQDGYNEQVYSFANCIRTMEGGTHLTGFRSALTRALNDYARKQNLLKDAQSNLSGDDTKEGLTAIISVKLTEPQFEGQTKTKLGNADMKGLVDSAVGEELSRYLEEHPIEAKRIIDKCLTTQRARDAARKARDLVMRKNALDGGSLPGKLADCSERAVHRGGRVGGRLSQDGPRQAVPGHSAHQRQDPQRREGSAREDPGPRRDTGTDNRAGGQRRRRLHPREAALPQDHHYDRRRCGRCPHTHPASHLLLPPYETSHRRRLSVYRPATPLPSGQGQIGFVQVLGGREG
jgi:DNA gyrase subunit B